MNLIDLPPEVLLTIFLYLRTKFVLNTVACVCKLFYYIITPETTWKTRFGKIWPKRVTNSDSGYISPRWKELCHQHEEFDKHWLEHEMKFDSFTISQEFPIDSVLLMNSGKTLITGSRDRSICVKDLENIKNVENPSELQSTVINRHEGWIWRLISDPITPGQFCSGSWDGYIMLWDLHRTEPISSVCLRTPPISMTWRSNDMIVAGCYDKTVRIIDPRTFSVVKMLKKHTRSVLCLHVDDDVIISGSEDKTLCIFDRKAGKHLQSLQLPSPAFSLHYWDDGYSLLRVAGRKNIYFVDSTENSYNLIKTNPNTGHSKRVNDFVQFKGGLLTASADGTLQVHEPSVLSQTRFILDQRKAEITRLSTCCDMLASASSDGSIRLWKVK
ncbi:F-box/WD repeat-containing protein 9-like [Dendronephthya gigantea]|uniref:F-box/WD repeat-containing protein 9-like n=1 Tax=Dendronephthya gigantea TaxID=151771 RepID=UPI00106C3B34|nr:F-box/WD repeat-containing protein 9-like [Dendronephthya gigantea]